LGLSGGLLLHALPGLSGAHQPVAAAAFAWLPVRRGPRATLRTAAAEAHRALGEFLTAERGLRTAIELARGRLADPVATLPAEVRAALEGNSGDPSALLAAATAEVDRLTSWLDTTRETLAATAPRTAEQRQRTTEALEEAATAARAAGVRPRAISRILSRAATRAATRASTQASAQANAGPRRLLAAHARLWSRLARRGPAVASWLSTRLPVWLHPTRRLPVPVGVTDGWAMTRPAPPGVGGAAWLNVWRVVSWVALDPLAASRQHGTSGLAAAELATVAEQGAPPGAPVWVHDLLRTVHDTGETHTELTERLAVDLAALQRHGLLDSRRDDDGTRHYRPGGLLGQLLARAPPGAAAALLANPGHVTGTALDTLPRVEQARAILGWLRATVLAHGEVERGVWAVLPLWLRGPSGWASARGLHATAAPTRAVAKAARAAATAEERARRAGLADDVVTALAAAHHGASTALANARSDARNAAAALGLGARRTDAATRRPSGIARALPGDTRVRLGGLLVVAGGATWLAGLKLAGLAAGSVVGLVIGVFGAGGALVTIPALSELFGQSAAHAAVGSLVIVGAAALINTLHGLIKRDLDWRMGALLGAAGFFPAVVGGVLAAHANVAGLQIALATLMGLAAVRMLRSTGAVDPARTGVTGWARTRRVLGIGLVAGLLTGVLGIGGAFLIIPALVVARVTDLRTATASVVMVTAINSVAGLLARTGELSALDWGLVGPFAGAAVIAGLIGKQLKDKLSVAGLQRGFAVFLIGVAGYTTFQAVAGLTGSALLAGGSAVLLTAALTAGAVAGRGLPGRLGAALGHGEVEVPARIAGTSVARQWAREVVGRVAWVALPVLGAFGAAQLVLGELTGSGAASADAWHNLFDLLPVALGVVGARIARPAFDRLSERLIGAMILVSGVTLFVESVLGPLLGHGEAVSSPVVVMVAGALGIVGNAIGAWLFSRTGNGTGEANLEHAIGDMIGSAAVALGGVGVLFGVGWADPVMAGFVSGLIVLMGVGQLTGTDIDLLELRHPRAWAAELRRALAEFGQLLGGIRNGRTQLGNAASELRAWRAERRVHRALGDRVMLPVGSLHSADPRLPPDLVELLAGSERFTVEGELVVRAWSVWTRAADLDLASLSPARLHALRVESARTLIAEGMGHRRVARLVGVSHRVLRGWLGEPGSVVAVAPKHGPPGPGPATGTDPETTARAVARVAGLLGLSDPESVAAIRLAYEVTWSNAAPFVTKIANDMLPDLRGDAAAGARVVFVGRDGASFALAARALDPRFFARHATEVVLPRAVVAAAVADVAARTGTSFRHIEAFLPPPGKVDPDDIPGAFDRLTAYLLAHGIAVDTPGAAATLVDSSFKGSIQVMLQALYPAVSFQGRYAFFGQSPHDPNPGTKQGYAVHQDGDRLTEELPEDPALTFSHAQGIGALEDTLNGPLSSPSRVEATGPVQTPLRAQTRPLAGLNPALVAAPYTDPRVREAVQRVNLSAVSDYAQHLAGLTAAGADTDMVLAAGAAHYTQAVWRWMTDRAPDPAFAQLADAFVYRADRKLIDELAGALATAGLSDARARRVWERFDRAGTLDAKTALVRAVRERNDRRALRHQRIRYLLHYPRPAVLAGLGAGIGVTAGLLGAGWWVAGLGGVGAVVAVALSHVGDVVRRGGTRAGAATGAPPGWSHRRIGWAGGDRARMVLRGIAYLGAGAGLGAGVGMSLAAAAGGLAMVWPAGGGIGAPRGPDGERGAVRGARAAGRIATGAGAAAINRAVLLVRAVRALLAVRAVLAVRRALVVLGTAALLVLVSPAPAAAVDGTRPVGGNHAELLVAAVVVLIAVTWLGAKLKAGLTTAGDRLRGALAAWFARWWGIAGRLFAGVLAGFVAADLTGHPMLAGLVLWGGVLLAGGDLMVRLVAGISLQDVARTPPARGPPTRRLLGVGFAAGALWWLHTSASTGALVWAVATPVAVAAVVAAVVAALIHWRDAIGRGVVALARRTAAALVRVGVRRLAAAAAGFAGGVLVGLPVVAAVSGLLVAGAVASRVPAWAGRPRVAWVLSVLGRYGVALLLGSTAGVLVPLLGLHPQVSLSVVVGGGLSGDRPGDPDPRWAALRQRLHHAATALTISANVAANRLGLQVWLTEVGPALLDARRELDELRPAEPSLAAALRLDTADTALTALEWVHTLLAHWPREGAVDPEFWAAGMQLLARHQALPPALAAFTRLLLARSVRRVFVRTDESAWWFLDRPRWAEDTVAAVLGDTAAADWFDKRWPRMSRRARLAFLVLLVETDGARWLVELPESRRSWRHMVDPLRLHTEPSLVTLRAGLAGLLVAWPEPGSAHRGQFLRAWLDLGQSLARRAPLLTRLGRPDHAARMLTTMARILTGPAPSEAGRARLLERVTARARRDTAEAAGALLGVRLPAGGGWDIVPGTPLWNAVVEYRWNAEAVGALAAYLRVWLRTGNAGLAGRAFRLAWALRLDHRYGYRAEFAHEQAPTDLTLRVAPAPAVVARAQRQGQPVPSGQSVLLGASTDPVEDLSHGYPDLHCLDPVTGELADLAETIPLHPRIVLLRAWEPLPDGGRGEQLAQLTVLVTEEGILPLDHPLGAEQLDLGPAFGHYLVEWAFAARLPLLKAVTPRHYYDPDRLPIPGFEHIRPEWLPITLPGIDGLRVELWADVLGERVRLPHHEELLVQCWEPPAWPRQASAQVSAPVEPVGLPVEPFSTTTPAGTRHDRESPPPDTARRITPDDPLGAQVHAAFGEFGGSLAALPVGPRTRAGLDDLLRAITGHSYWAPGGPANWVETVPDAPPWPDGPALRLWLSEPSIISAGRSLASTFSRLGLTLGAEDATSLAVRYLTWHELAHLLQHSYGRLTGRGVHALAEDALRAGVSAPLAMRLGSLSTADRVETERFAEGLALLLLTRHIRDTSSLTDTQARRLGATLRATLTDTRHRRFAAPGDPLGHPTPEATELPGYLYFHSDGFTRAILELAARYDGHRPAGEPTEEELTLLARRLAGARSDLRLWLRAAAIRDGRPDPGFAADLWSALERFANTGGTVLTRLLGTLHTVLPVDGFAEGTELGFLDTPGWVATRLVDGDPDVALDDDSLRRTWAQLAAPARFALGALAATDRALATIWLVELAGHDADPVLLLQLRAWSASPASQPYRALVSALLLPLLDLDVGPGRVAAFRSWLELVLTTLRLTGADQERVRRELGALTIRLSMPPGLGPPGAAASDGAVTASIDRTIAALRRLADDDPRTP
jgi:uncharacterized membrane protein YfcA/Co/Zn/Cd efflux system component